MQITINGRVEELTENFSLAEFIAGHGFPDRGVAVAVDGSVIPKARWQETRVEDRQVIEVLTAVQGG